jgi:hypothetical protein
MNMFVEGEGAIMPTSKTENGDSAVSKADFTSDNNVWSALVALNTYLVRGVGNNENVLRTILTPTLVENQINEALFLRLLAYNRDSREGKGERLISHRLIVWLIEQGHLRTASNFLSALPSVYGYWGDMRDLYKYVALTLEGRLALRNGSLKDRNSSVSKPPHTSKQGAAGSKPTHTSKRGAAGSKPTHISQKRVASNNSYAVLYMGDSDEEEGKYRSLSLIYRNRSHEDSSNKEEEKKRCKRGERIEEVDAEALLQVRKDLQLFQSFIVKLVANRLRNEERLMINKKERKPEYLNDALLAKWCPTEGGKHDDFFRCLALAMFTSKDEKSSFGKLRKLITKLREANLVLVETLMSKREFGLIEPEKVPSKAMKKYRKCFMSGSTSVDEGRLILAEKLNAILTGRAGSKKLRTAGLQFYELLKNYITSRGSSGEDPVLEGQARIIIDDMRKMVESSNFPISVAMVDVSGSMTGVPMEVAVSLGILLANIMPAPWKGRVLTFSSNPSWHMLDTTASLFFQVKSIMSAEWGMSTNFRAAMRLVMELAEGEKASNLPENLFCFTDMQFDSAASGNGCSSFKDVSDMFTLNLHAIPRIVFWNLSASGTVTFSAPADTENVCFLSGFSQSAFKAFCNGLDFESFNPISILKGVLMSQRYDMAAEAVYSGSC